MRQAKVNYKHQLSDFFASHNWWLSFIPIISTVSISAVSKQSAVGIIKLRFNSELLKFTNDGSTNL